MNETHRRPWWRLHGVTWLCITLFFVCILFAGSHSALDLTLQQRRWIGSVGWPRTFLLTYYQSDGTPEGRVLIVGEWDDLVTYLWPFRLISDFAVVIAIVSGSAFTVERNCRDRATIASMSLKSVLVAVAAIASFIAITDGAHWTYMLALAGHSGLCVGIVLAWIAFFDILGLAWNGLTFRRPATEASDPQSAPPVV